MPVVRDNVIVVQKSKSGPTGHCNMPSRVVVKAQQTFLQLLVPG